MIQPEVLILYGMIIGIFFGFSFAIAMGEIRIIRIIRTFKEVKDNES